MPIKALKQVHNQVEKIEKTTAKNQRLIPKWLLLTVAIFLSFIIILSASVYLYQLNYANKVYAGIKVGNLSLSGKTKEQANALIQAKVDELASSGINFQYNDHIFTLYPIVSTGKDYGLTYELWMYDPGKIADSVYQIGRQGNWLKQSRDQIHYLLNQKTITVTHQINYDQIKQILKQNFIDLESPARNADLVFEDDDVYISDESTGYAFDYDLAIGQLENNLNHINKLDITLALIPDNPTITKSDSEFLLGQIDSILGLSPLTLEFTIPEYYTGYKRFKQTRWIIDKEPLKDWLTLKSNSNQIYTGIDQEKATEYLTDISEGINTPAKNAKFVLTDGRVSEWQSSRDGFLLNTQKTIQHIEYELIKNKNNQINLVLLIDKTKITNDNVNDLGINELIGVGESNFRGSPRNRRYNIRNGADSINGLLIKPDEEFSMLDALGDINALTGYLPELVIKEGRTVPEYGGGLCQIGTTMFRLAINSGLPVTDRRNHSYRVSYYEPAGTDATIYDPWPDLKFKNDTNNHLLLQTRIEGNELIFEFWGTKDGRQVATTSPAIYNIKAPPPAKYVETDELPPGETKLLEHAHNGADAHFERTIEWPPGTDKDPIDEVWASHYVPWQETYLIGKATATSTIEKPENIE